MTTLVLYVVFVIAFFALIQGCYLLVADVREEAAVAATQLRLRRPTLADGVSPWLKEILLTAPIRSFDNLVQTCGIGMRTERVLLGMVVLTLIAFVPFNLWFRDPVRSLACALAVSVGLPLLVLRSMRTARMKRLAQQLPETLDMMVRSLKAGHPIPACIALIAREMPAPIGAEFKQAHETMVYGLDLRDALAKMTERLHTVQELKYFASAVKIQSTTGGNLAEVLESLSKLLRDQQKLKMKVRAISAEGRMSGNILTALPIGVFVMLNIITPSYYHGILDSSGTALAMYIAGGLLVSGFLLIRHFVNIRV
jgi:tight adherence protein B